MGQHAQKRTHRNPTRPARLKRKQRRLVRFGPSLAELTAQSPDAPKE